MMRMYFVGGHSGTGYSRSSTMTNGESSSRYSTRTKTGSVKPRRYNNEGVFTDMDDMEVEEDKPSRRKGRRRYRKSVPNNKMKSQVEDSGSDTEIDEELAQTSTRPSRRPLQRSQSPPHRKTHSSDSDNDVVSQNKYLTRKSSRLKQQQNYNDTNSDTEEEEISFPRKSTRSHKPVHRLALTLNVNRNSVQSSSPKYSSSSNSDTKSDWVSESETHSSSGTESMETEYISTSVASNLRKTRNQGKRTVPYREYSEDDNNSDSANISHDNNSGNTDVGRSVSSRGRVRRATAKAKALWN